MYSIQLQYGTGSNDVLHFSKGSRSLQRAESPRVHSLPFDIPRLLLMSMENVPRMVNSLCASIPRGIDVHGKAVHGHSYTGVTTQRH